MPTPTMSRDEAMDLWEKSGSPSTEDRDRVEVFFDRVLLRRDVVLVYQDIETEEVKFVSYGSSQALLSRQRFGFHPTVLPDTPGQNNYRYHLKGVVDGRDAPKGLPADL